MLEFRRENVLFQPAYVYLPNFMKGFYERFFGDFCLNFSSSIYFVIMVSMTIVIIIVKIFFLIRRKGSKEMKFRPKNNLTSIIRFQKKNFFYGLY